MTITLALDNVRDLRVRRDYPDRASWLDARRRFVTATDIGGICGVSRFSTPLSVYADKVTPGSEKDDNTRMLIGRMLQQGVADTYAVLREQRDGVHIEIDHMPAYTMFEHPHRPLVAASPDAFQYFGDPDSDERDERILEIKTTDSYPDEPYDEWLTQVQWQMLATGNTDATIAALCGGNDLRWWDVSRDEDAIQTMIEAASQFWGTHIAPQVPPPSDGARASRSAMRALYPMSQPGQSVQMDAGDLERVRLILDAKASMARLEALVGEHEDALKQKMGTAEEAFLPDGGKLRWKSFKKAAYMVKESIVRPFSIVPPK